MNNPITWGMRRYALLMMIVGIIAGLFFWSSLWCINLIQEAFKVNDFMGWATLFCLGLIVGGFCYLCFVEFSGYVSIRRVDRLAAAIAGDNVGRAKKLAKKWLAATGSDHEQLEHMESIEEIRQYIASQLTTIDANVDKLIAKESVVIAAFVGISPWAIIDGAIVAWRQLRMMRNIAASYGLRPSAIGTVRILQKVLVSVVFADVSEHATQWVASKVPSVGGLIPRVGQSLAVFVLTVRVGMACKVACRPVPKPKSDDRSFISTLRGMKAKIVLLHKKCVSLAAVSEKN